MECLSVCVCAFGGRDRERERKKKGETRNSNNTGDVEKADRTGAHLQHNCGRLSGQASQEEERVKEGKWREGE